MLKMDSLMEAAQQVPVLAADITGRLQDIESRLEELANLAHIQTLIQAHQLRELCGDSLTVEHQRTLRLWLNEVIDREASRVR